MAQIPVIIGSGLLAARPAASAANEGYLYLVTDENTGTLYRSNGSDWVQVSASVASGVSAHDAVTLGADADALLALTGQALGLDTQVANRVLAGPTTGADADPTFRALVAADLGTETPNGTKFLRDDLSWRAMAAVSHAAAIEFVLYDGGAVLGTGIKFRGIVPYDMTIQGVIANADQAGSAVVDLWVEDQADYPPTDDDSICAGTPVTIDTDDQVTDTTLTDWITSLTRGQAIWANVDECTSITMLTVLIYGVQA